MWKLVKESMLATLAVVDHEWLDHLPVLIISV